MASSEDNSVNAAMQARMKDGRYVFSDEEQRVLRECRFESFWYRAFPLAAAAGTSTHLLVQRGILSPSRRYGSVPKVIFASLCGYILGKMLYVQQCRQKFLRLENSPFAEMVRKGRGGMPGAAGGFGGMQMPGFEQGFGRGSRDEGAFGDSTPRDDTPWSGGHDQRLNMDIDTSGVKGIDNTFDSDVNQLDEENTSKNREMTRTYDELRKQNREKNLQQYTQVLPGHFQPKEVPSSSSGPRQDLGQPGSRRPARPDHEDEFQLGARNRKRMLNKYGDTWESSE